MFDLISYYQLKQNPQAMRKWRKMARRMQAGTTWTINTNCKWYKNRAKRKELEFITDLL